MLSKASLLLAEAGLLLTEAGLLLADMDIYAVTTEDKPKTDYLVDDLVDEILLDGLVDEILVEDPLDAFVADIVACDPLADIVDAIMAVPPPEPVVISDDDMEALVQAVTATPKAPKVSVKVKNDGSNATSKFLDKRLRETGGYQGTLMRALRTAVVNHLPMSYTVGMVDDHIQTCFSRLISRDSLADRLAEGHLITDQQLAMFAVRSGYTDVRDSGTNPVCRELYGARTEREREKGVGFLPMMDARIVWSSEEDGEGDGAWTDIADNAANQEDAVAFAQVWDRLEGIIRKHKPQAADRYIGLLRSKANGAALADIADEENVSTSRATSMMAEIRRVLRQGDLNDLGLYLTEG